MGKGDLTAKAQRETKAKVNHRDTEAQGGDEDDKERSQ
jgi:hypothetical protein